MKVYAALAIFAFAVLAAFAVWFGGLNQDEGWYLYAAQLVGEGKVLYRDFAYTQGPLLPKFYKSFAWVWANGRGLLGARIFTVTIGLGGVLLAELTELDEVEEDLSVLAQMELDDAERAILRERLDKRLNRLYEGFVPSFSGVF